jgi:hypothetical protein
VVLVVVVQLVVVAAVEAAAVAPAAAKAAVAAVVAAPSVVGATLRSRFQLGRGTSNRMPSAAAAAAAAAAALYLHAVTTSDCGTKGSASAHRVDSSSTLRKACEARFSFFSTLSPRVSSRPPTHVSSTGTHAVSNFRGSLVQSIRHTCPRLGWFLWRLPRRPHLFTHSTPGVSHFGTSALGWGVPASRMVAPGVSQPFDPKAPPTGPTMPFTGHIGHTARAMGLKKRLTKVMRLAKPRYAHVVGLCLTHAAGWTNALRWGEGRLPRHPVDS